VHFACFLYWPFPRYSFTNKGKAMLSDTKNLREERSTRWEILDTQRFSVSRYRSASVFWLYSVRMGRSARLLTTVWMISRVMSMRSSALPARPTFFASRQTRWSAHIWTALSAADSMSSILTLQACGLNPAALVPRLITHSSSSTPALWALSSKAVSFRGFAQWRRLGC
jgi:hypothetical protein